MAETGATYGIVAIGRNEGERLQRCLRSIPQGVHTVYVDSASSDDSVAFARAHGADVVELDLDIPFTAARARNEGFAQLIHAAPGLHYVQFVDGDCEIEDGWCDHAAQILASNISTGGVCGRRRERYPDASFYNALCDDEWDTPVGPALASGGDAMFRREALEQVGAFDTGIMAGEEPEMCHRLRASGWNILRIDAPMTIHDADMHHFRQWWLRAVRSGFGYAQVWDKTRRSPADTLYARELSRSLGWTLGVIILALLATLILGIAGLLLAPALWALQFLRIALRSGPRMAIHLMLGKFAELRGMARYALSRIQGRKQGTIFYK